MRVGLDVTNVLREGVQLGRDSWLPGLPPPPGSHFFLLIPSGLAFLLVLASWQGSPNLRVFRRAQVAPLGESVTPGCVNRVRMRCALNHALMGKARDDSRNFSPESTPTPRENISAETLEDVPAPIFNARISQAQQHRKWNQHSKKNTSFGKLSRNAGLIFGRSGLRSMSGVRAKLLVWTLTGVRHQWPFPSS